MTDLTLETRKLSLWQLLGPDAPELLKSNSLDLPEVMQATATATGFIARPGFDEFLIQTSQPPVTPEGLCWLYSRADKMLALQGEGWTEVMAQVCHMDLSDIKKDDWVMVTAAGINVWCLGLEDGLLMGCDPSLGGYFSDTLNTIVCEINETLSTD